MNEQDGRHDNAHFPYAKRCWIIGGCVAVTLTLITIVYMFWHRPAHPIPTHITSRLSFPLAYPARLPEGYSYKADSATYAGGVLFFQITNDKKSIFVSQQRPPTKPTLIQYLKDFAPLDTPIGKGYAGEQNNTPSVLIENKESLVSVSGSPDTSADVVNAIAEELQMVK